MAIQYRCESCAEPIEVDDELAGQTARCPYCGSAGTIPAHSTYAPGAAVVARPARWEEREEATSETFQRTPSVPPATQRRARTLGTYALVTTLLGLLCLGVAMVRSLMLLARLGLLEGEPAEAQKALAETFDPVIVVAQFAMALLLLAGFVLSIVSLAQSRRGNWTALTALLLCLGLGTCLVLAVLVTLAGLGAG